MNRKMIAVILCIICIFGSMSHNVSAQIKQSNGQKLKEMYKNGNEKLKISKQKEKKQYKLNKDYKKIEDKMILKKGTDSTCEYEDFYGGSYIDKNDNLVVCITDNEIKDEIDDIATDFDTDYQIVENSYNELADVQIELGDIYTDLYDKFSYDSEKMEFLKSIVGIGINEESNKVEVDIYNLDNEKRNLYETLFGNFECVELVNCQDTFKESSTHRPGRALYVVSKASDSTDLTTKRVSMGYRALYNSPSGKTIYGFTTCGHVVKDAVGGKIYTSSSCSVAIGIRYSYAYHDSVDASFIKLISGFDIGTSVRYSDSSGSTTGADSIAAYRYMESVAKGSIVYKVGSTTYKTSAEVTSTNYSITFNGVKFTNQTKTEYFCDSGDSGGMVYMYYNGKYLPVGLIKGSGYILWYEYSYYTKASEVVRLLGVYPY